LQLLNVRQVLGPQRRESVAAFMQHGAYIIAHADGVHEDEWALSDGKAGAITAGRFALAAVQIERLFLPQDCVILAQLRIDMLEICSDLAISSATFWNGCSAGR
jgi:hypothetical protein